MISLLAAGTCTTSLSMVETAGLSPVWHRWVAEGSGGHLFVLAQRQT